MSYTEVANMLDYDPSTGALTWKVGKGARYEGLQAGYVHDTKKGYLKVKHNKKRYFAHRLAWIIHYGKEPDSILDHIDGNPVNNAIDNLREVTGSENARNQKLSKNNKSGFVGVYKLSLNSYKVICAGRVVGIYRNFEDAVRARIKAEEEMGGFTARHGREK